MTGSTAVIVSFNPAYQVRAGNSEYLASFTQSLSGAGFDVSIMILEEIPANMARIAAIDDYTALYSGFRTYRAIRFGGHFYSLNPRNWWNAILRIAGLHPGAGKPRVHRFGFDCYVPRPGALRWARRRLRRVRPSFVVANYFNAAPIFDQLSPGTATAILTHDVLALREISVDAAGATADFDRTLIAAEALAFNKADVCFAIKPEEEEIIRRIAPETKAVSMPMAIEIGKNDLSGHRGPVCIFVGSDHPANKLGLQWLLTEAWPRVLAKRPDARLHVVGTSAYSIEVPLPPNVELIGFVDDLAGAYARASVSLTPVLYGSGVKIKLVEGLAAGLPSVATTVGAEGVPPTTCEVLRIADGAEPYANAILEALETSDDVGHREAARAFARKHYDKDKVGVRVIGQLVADGLVKRGRSARSGARLSGFLALRR